VVATGNEPTSASYPAVKFAIPGGSGKTGSRFANGGQSV